MAADGVYGEGQLCLVCQSTGALRRYRPVDELVLEHPRRPSEHDTPRLIGESEGLNQSSCFTPQAPLGPLPHQGGTLGWRD